jgi:(E)-4-hydroxy-3-methylbut-2-enyl-diphosphate synthase
MRCCESPCFYQRRPTREVLVGDPARGGVIIGGHHPVVAQSMLTCDTKDTAECVRQTLELAAVGCQLVRITAPTVQDAANLRNIAGELRRRGCQVPLAADIHFKPEAALEAAQWVEKVRINPGNFADAKKFAVKEYDDAAYLAELERIEERFTPLAQLCRRLGRALRIGTNHGSLSDRILNRYGDTPMGMVESALEFARICRRHDYHNFLFSMKSSNPKVMIECYRLLAAKLEQLGPDWNYPMHLGVTEAGEGEDGRIKSAIGIGSLLCDGIGDTIRVSLTEDSPREIPVCLDLIAQVPALTAPLTPGSHFAPCDEMPFDPFAYNRRPSAEVELAPGLKCGGEQTVRVLVSRFACQQLEGLLPPGEEVRPEGVFEEAGVVELDPADFSLPPADRLVTAKDGVGLAPLAAFRLLAARLKQKGALNPIVLKDHLEANVPALESKIALLRAAAVLGGLLADGIGDAILVRGESDPLLALRLAYNILQASGCRSFKTDYVACPSCGRTLFDLQAVTARIKARTGHLKGVRIAVMGCIVNGPGEMADADFGYVGGAPGKVNLYVGRKAVRFHVPEAEAVDRLVELIQEHGKWRAPANG